MAPRLLAPLPVSNSTLPFWRTELDALDSHNSTPKLPSHVDILVIGAGFTGVSTAYHLLDNEKSPPSIAILEAREAMFWCHGSER
jgi:NADH dehydrogenase FAD-containing subunit